MAAGLMMNLELGLQQGKQDVLGFKTGKRGDNLSSQRDAQLSLRAVFSLGMG